HPGRRRPIAPGGDHFEIVGHFHRQRSFNDSRSIVHHLLPEPGDLSPPLLVAVRLAWNMNRIAGKPAAVRHADGLVWLSRGVSFVAFSRPLVIGCCRKCAAESFLSPARTPEWAKR